MAEMDTSSSGGHKKGPGVKKGKKLSTRVDLTPMCDLGFLLITFFMYTTTMAKPKTMEINMPYKDPTVKDETKVKESEALTILLSKNHRIYYYEGIGSDPNNPPKVEVTYFKPKDGIRDVILGKIQKVNQLKASGVLGPKDETTVLIKPDTSSTYADLVGVLDEMSIDEVKTYAIVDITQQDRDFMYGPGGGAAQPAAKP